MAKPKRECPSPCEMKGRHHGRLGSGAIYQIEGVRWIPQGCECMERWRDFGYTDEPDPARRVSGFMDRATAALTLTEDPQERLGPGSHPVLPCNETFRYSYSQGTRIFREALSDQSRFRGCQELEDALVHAKQIRHVQAEVLGSGQDFGLSLESLETELDDEAPEQQLSREKNWDTREPGQTALSLERANLPDDPVSSVWSESAPDASEGTEPSSSWVSYLRQNLQELKLTYKQKSAVKHFILENDEALKIGEVARKLRISVDSLKDRINQVRKKVLARFPEATGDAVRPPKQERKNFECDLAYGGFYRKSSARIRAPIYRISPADPTRREPVPDRGAKSPRKPRAKKERAWLAERRAWEKSTTYTPNHDGVFCPWIPPGPKKTRKGKDTNDPVGFRRRLFSLRDYERP